MELYLINSLDGVSMGLRP